MVEKIVSGGQTGVDRAALDAALELDMACAGWCPKGRLAEDGVIDDRYPLQETESAQYKTRTRYNVRDSDATLIVFRGELEGGTAYTVRIAEQINKPHFLLDLNKGFDERSLTQWIQQNQVRVLNIAGPRERKNPGIYQETFALLLQYFSEQ